jgi:heterodisulfide reductase subunit A
MTKNKITGAVLIAGGGIAGIQAALDLANSGYYVYMVEKTPSIGGVMAQLDKTFPTNDCSMCIMSPKLVEAGRHINIELITLAQIENIRGEKGNFKVDIFQKARYVNMDKCIACGVCAEKCPKKVIDIYNEKLVKRKAIYVPYPQAVPLKYSIDAENCLKLTKDKCGNCEKQCPAGAINYDDKDKNITLNVGSVILAPGFKAYDPSGKRIYSYDNNPDIVTSLEFERLLSASGPNQGHLVRMSDHVEPKKIAWLQCVGSRDINTCENGHCSSVCCMYAIKQAIIAKEHDPSLDCAIFYIDIRTHGKGFESCYNEAKNKHGIRFVRCKVHSVFPQPGEEKGQIIDYFDEQTGKTIRDVFDIVVLSVGMEIASEVKAFAEKTGVELTPGGFCKTGSFDPVSTSRDGIYVCGAFNGPKDIPQSVIEAGSAALCAGSALIEVRNSLTKALTMPPEIDIYGERPRIGVFVCHCGINIGSVVDVPAVCDFAKDLPFVEYADDNLYSCSQDTQDAIVKVIKEQKLNRVVVAACTPRTHDPLFQETLMNAGLNKYLFEMVNIRNHDSWVHKDYPEMATKKAKDLVKMAVAKAAMFEPLKEATLEVDQNALIIGGGISGMAAAKSLADQGYKVNLVEKDVKLGGNANHLYLTSKGESIQEGLCRMVKSVENHPNITIYLNAKLDNVDGFVGNFDSVVKTGSKSETIHHGVTIIAAGAHEYKPDEYLYGNDPRVLTGMELDRKFINNDPSLKDIKTAVFIQCVGSREPSRPYCSRICCTHSIVSALHLKELNPAMKIFVLYRDIRTYGEREQVYKKAREKDVIFIRFGLENKPKVTACNHGLEIEVVDHVLNMPVTITADILNLAAAVVPYKDEQLAQFFKVPVNDEGFFAEAHVKLAPSDFAVDGVFLCGLAHYPKPIDEAVAQAQAAASSATRLLAQKTIKTIGTVASVVPSFCCSCGVCISVCPYKAPFIRTEGPNAGKADINPVLCKGCGACAASCRSGALHLKGFEESQIMAMIANA